MPRGVPHDTTKTVDLLWQIHTLRIASVAEIGTIGEVTHLVKQGFIYKVWIGNYALTKAGERAYRQAME